MTGPKGKWCQLRKTSKCIQEKGMRPNMISQMLGEVTIAIDFEIIIEEGRMRITDANLEVEQMDDILMKGFQMKRLDMVKDNSDFLTEIGSNE